MLWQKIRSGSAAIIKKAHTNRFLSKRSIFAIVVLLAGVLLAAYLETRPRLAPGQTPLADIGSIETLRTQFNIWPGGFRAAQVISLIILALAIYLIKSWEKMN